MLKIDLNADFISPEKLRPQQAGNMFLMLSTMCDVVLVQS